MVEAHAAGRNCDGNAVLRFSCRKPVQRHRFARSQRCLAHYPYWCYGRVLGSTCSAARILGLGPLARARARVAWWSAFTARCASTPSAAVARRSWASSPSAAWASGTAATRSAAAKSRSRAVVGEPKRQTGQPFVWLCACTAARAFKCSKKNCLIQLKPRRGQWSPPQPSAT